MQLLLLLLLLWYSQGLKLGLCTCKASALPLSCVSSPERATFTTMSHGTVGDAESEDSLQTQLLRAVHTWDSAQGTEPFLGDPAHSVLITLVRKLKGLNIVILLLRIIRPDHRGCWCQSWAWNYSLRSFVTNSFCWTIAKANYGIGGSLIKTFCILYSCHFQEYRWLSIFKGSIDPNKQIKSIQRKKKSCVFTETCTDFLLIIP